MKTRIFFLLSLLVLLAGCAAPQQRDRQAEIKGAMDSADASCRAHYADPRINPVRDRLPDRLNEATFEQLSDSRKPTPTEVTALKVRGQAFLLCSAGYRNALTQTGAAAPYLTAHDLNVNRIAGLSASLVNGELSYGQYLRSAQESNLARQRVFQDIDAAMRAEGEREAMRRVQAYQIWRSLQPVTCFRSGAYTTCQ
jgi:hypothetical protein